MKRIGTTEAANRLGFGPEWVRTLVKTKVLSAITMSGSSGTGQRYYFDPGEVDAMAEGGAPAAKAYREAKMPAIAKKKPRGRKVTAFAKSGA